MPSPACDPPTMRHHLMASFRFVNNRLVATSTCSYFSRAISSFTAKAPITASVHSLAECSMEQGSELFEYTSGRWMSVDHFSTKLTLVTDCRQSWNDAFKHSERRRLFNISELKHLAASAVDRSPGDVARFEKLGEGGFNRSFLITMRDGFQLVGRIPYTTTEPKQLVIASEVATMDFLRMHGIPVPKIYSYSATSENPAGTEYIFMELVQGTNLGDIWFDLPEKARITVVTRLVELESRLFALPFSASGSLYYTKDLDINIRKAGVTTTNTSARGSFCIGPDTRLCLWYGKRSRLNLDRGPCTYPVFSTHASHSIYVGWFDIGW